MLTWPHLNHIIRRRPLPVRGHVPDEIPNLHHTTGNGQRMPTADPRGSTNGGKRVGQLVEAVLKLARLFGMLGNAMTKPFVRSHHAVQLDLQTVNLGLQAVCLLQPHFFFNRHAVGLQAAVLALQAVVLELHDFVLDL